MERFVVAVVSLLLSLLAASPNGMERFEIKCLFLWLSLLAGFPHALVDVVVAVVVVVVVISGECLTFWRDCC